MRILILFFIVTIASTVIVKAQNNAAAKAPTASETSVAAPEKMFFRGSINKSFFEMRLVRDGHTLSGNYFYTKSAVSRANSLKLRGKIDADGKFVLQEFNAVNKQTGEFKGELGENPEGYDLYLKGTWKAPRKKSLEFAAVGQAIDFTADWQIETRAIRENSKRLSREIDAEYPEITNASGGNVSRFNLTAKERVGKPVAEFKRHTARIDADERKSPLFGGNSFDVSYQIKLANDDFVSIEYGYSESSHGMAHPMFYFEYLNYDLKTNRKLTLAEQFAPGAKYLERLSEYCLQELQSRPPVNEAKLAEGEWKTGADPDAENFEQWSLMKKGLLITFNEYQIAPYSAGVSFVLVPYSKLRDIARPGSALAKMAQ